MLCYRTDSVSSTDFSVYYICFPGRLKKVKYSRTDIQNSELSFISSDKNF